MGPKDADRMANIVDPDQTAPLAAVRSGSTMTVRKLRFVTVFLFVTNLNEVIRYT